MSDKPDGCSHEYVFMMGKSEYFTSHTDTYKRVHWCWKCGTVLISTPNRHIKNSQ